MGSGWDFVRQGGRDIGTVLSLAPLDERAFSDWVDDNLLRKSMPRSAVVNRSGLNHTYAYQILSGSRRPARDKLIQICFGMELCVEEAGEALACGGVSPLRPECRRDVIIAFCLERGLGVTGCDGLLWELGERTLSGEGYARPAARDLLAGS